MDKNTNCAEYNIVKSISTIFRVPKNIIDKKIKVSNCSKCKSALEKSHTLIPLKDGGYADIPGMWCRNCNILYVKNGSFIPGLIKDNPRAQGFSYNGKPIFNYSTEQIQSITADKIRKSQKNEKQRRLAEVRSALVMICVRFDDNSNREFIIASHRNDVYYKKAILYVDDIGRELLSAAYARQRNKRGIINKNKFTVTECVYPSSTRRHMPEYIVPTSLLIRQDGGFRSSLENNHMEIINTLLYSPYTNRYEIIHSTLDKFRGFCFVDIKLYREYVKKFGRPDCSPDFSDYSTGSEMSFDGMNTESILKGYGYSVNEKDGLRTSVRQELLAEIVDLEILTVSKVVDYLDFFIRSHPSVMYTNARHKWEEDKRFIQEYRVKPNRFLIANKVARN